MTKDRNRAEQRAARALMESAGIKYTHALRLLREAKENPDEVRAGRQAGDETNSTTSR